MRYIVQYFDKYASQLISIIVCDKFYTRPHLQTKHLTGNELNYFYLIHNGKFNFKDMKLHIQEKVIIVDYTHIHTHIYLYIFIYIYIYIYIFIYIYIYIWYCNINKQRNVVLIIRLSNY